MVEFFNDYVILQDVPYFDIEETLECGQCFRFDKLSDNYYKTVAFNKVLYVRQEDGKIYLENTTKQDYLDIWQSYFDLSTDYNAIMEELFSRDNSFSDIASYSKGIRILRQEAWETLCSFIVSQNNNIPRIKKITKKLCESFGDKIAGSDDYTFPTADKLAGLTVDELSELRAGFRAKYIIDAANKVSSGSVSLDMVSKADIENAKAELMKIKGVGIKVATCTLLYGFHRLEAFPEDVWIKKAMQSLYGGKSYDMFGKYAGVAQQYIYNYIRNKA